MAVPTTWTDIKDFNPDILITANQPFSYTHDITDGPNGFNGVLMGNGGDDVIYSYSLSVALHDDGGLYDGAEIAFIDQPGLLGDSVVWNFNYVNTYGWSLAGLVQLNLTGTLKVTVSSWYGDFFLDSSTLIAKGDNGVSTAPVPEPATMLLLGAGLLSIAGFSRKRFRK